MLRTAALGLLWIQAKSARAHLLPSQTGVWARCSVPGEFSTALERTHFASCVLLLESDLENQDKQSLVLGSSHLLGASW